MKTKYKYLLIVLVVSIGGCNDEFEELSTTSMNIIRGKIFYYDITNGNRIDNNSEIKISLKTRDSLNLDIVDEIQNSTGSEYEFGQLKDGFYQIDAEYKDSINGITYLKSLQFNSSLINPINQDIQLMPDGNSILIRGELKRMNPFTGKLENVSILARGKISCSSCTFQIPDNGDIIVINGNYFIPSLPKATYNIEFEDTDSIGIKYSSLIKTVSTFNDSIHIINDTLKENGEQLFVTGELKRLNPFTGFEENVSAEAKGKISCKTCIHQLPNNGMIAITNGSYSIPTLIKDTYILEFEDMDAIGLKYYTTDTVQESDGTIQIRNQELEENRELLFIRGNISYKDPINATIKIPTSPISISVFSTPLYAEISQDKIAIIDNNQYLIGPLQKGNYEINSSWNNDLGISFEYQFNIDLQGVDLISEKEIPLTRVESTALLGNVKDALGNGVNDVNVFLYNNYDFLLTYQDSANAFIQYKVTNEDGLVYFNDLEEIPYFVFAKKIQGNDTLTNLNSEFDPSTTPPLNLNALDTLCTFIK